MYIMIFTVAPVLKATLGDTDQGRIEHLTLPLRLNAFNDEQTSSLGIFLVKFINSCQLVNCSAIALPSK